MVKHILNYIRSDENHDVAKIKSISMMSTKIVPGEDDLPLTTWELYLEIETFKRFSEIVNPNYLMPQFSFTITETLVNIDNEPREYLNPDILNWLSEEEIKILHQRLVWIGDLPLVIDLNLPQSYNEKNIQKTWSVDEIEKILKMESDEIDIIKSQWEKRRTYEKFGL